MVGSSRSRSRFRNVSAEVTVASEIREGIRESEGADDGGTDIRELLCSHPDDRSVRSAEGGADSLRTISSLIVKKST